MKNLIDFSTGTGTSIPTVIQPDFSIAQRTPQVTLQGHASTPYFRLAVGCQSMTVTAKTLEVLREEIEFPAEKAVTKKVLFKIGTKPTKSAAKLGEESPTYYISEAGKLYPKKLYTTGDISFVEPRKYFTKSGKSMRASAGTGYWYTIDSTDLKNLKHILSIMNEYFNPVSNAEPKITKKKAVK